MILVDTNIISYLILETQYTKPVEKLFIKDNDWYSPQLWKSEFRSVLSLYINQKILKLEEALNIYTKANEIINTIYTEPDSKAILELSVNNKLSVYDCEFIFWAQAKKLPLITYDKRVLHAFSEFSFTPDEYLNKHT